jgi:hypothetical protein
MVTAVIDDTGKSSRLIKIKDLQQRSAAGTFALERLM